MKIHIETINNDDQRYPTAGDYWTDENGVLQMRVSKMNDDYEFLVIIHEMIEAYLTQKRGIKHEEIDRFDMKFEMDRKLGQHDIDEEPGDCKASPYYKEHQFATGIERVLANELDVDWNDYDEAVMSL